jgi:hypothetical protein
MFFGVQIPFMRVLSPDSVNMPSTLKFPSAGIWKVLVYIDRELYESIVIEAV